MSRALSARRRIGRGRLGVPAASGPRGLRRRRVSERRPRDRSRRVMPVVVRVHVLMRVS